MLSDTVQTALCDTFKLWALYTRRASSSLAMPHRFLHVPMRRDNTLSHQCRENIRSEQGQLGTAKVSGTASGRGGNFCHSQINREARSDIETRRIILASALLQFHYAGYPLINSDALRPQLRKFEQAGPRAGDILYVNHLQQLRTDRLERTAYHKTLEEAITPQAAASPCLKLCQKRSSSATLLLQLCAIHTAPTFRHYCNAHLFQGPGCGYRRSSCKKKWT